MRRKQTAPSGASPLVEAAAKKQNIKKPRRKRRYDAKLQKFVEDEDAPGITYGSPEWFAAHKNRKSIERETWMEKLRPKKPKRTVRTGGI